MVVGFDGKRAVLNNTGLGNYSRVLVQSLAENNPRSQFILYTPKLVDNPNLRTVMRYSNVHIKTPRKAIIGSYWRSVHGMMSDAHHNRVNIFHGLSGELPLDIRRSDIPSVVTVHDLIFLRFPQYYNFIDRKIYDFKARKACVNANRIIAISECTKRDIVHFYGIDPEKIDVAYQGCNQIFHEEVTQAQIDKVRSKYDLPHNFIVCVGTVEERKNALLAVKALADTDDKEVKLVLIGHHTKYFDKIKAFVHANGLRHHVVCLSRVRFKHLPVIYHMARASVYPSRYEGFGLPVLESQSCGTPVIAAKGSCLEEAGGKAAIYVDPDSVEQMTAALNTVLGDSARHEQMVKDGLENAAKFNNDAMAQRVMEIYRNVLNSI